MEEPDKLPMDLSRLINYHTGLLTYSKNIQTLHRQISSGCLFSINAIFKILFLHVHNTKSIRLGKQKMDLLIDTCCTATVSNDACWNKIDLHVLSVSEWVFNSPPPTPVVLVARGISV